MNEVPFHHQLHEDDKHTGYLPATLIQSDSALINAERLSSVVDHHLRLDDVMHPQFLATVIIRTSDKIQDIQFERATKDIIQTWKAAVYHLVGNGDRCLVQSGPCFLSNNTLHQALRLYRDTQEAFVTYGYVSSTASARYFQADRATLPHY